ncbi:MAG: hypothetical protein Q9170_004491 [Blastenia crenularia]
MLNPPLTPLGEQQCRDFCAKFPYHSSINLLVTSPLRRTIQTTLLGFEPEISRGIQCIALSEIQETSDLPCDTGSNLSTLKQDFKSKPISFSLVPEDWDSKQGRWAPVQEAIEVRCREARKWLKARDEEAIVVVTHGQVGEAAITPYAHAYSSRHVGTGWENVEFRSYRFVDHDDENAAIEETVESRQRRSNKDKPLTKEEKAQLRETATKKWQGQGYEKDSKA